VEPGAVRRLLVVAPGFAPWDLGTRVAQLASGQGIRCTRFDYTASDQERLLDVARSCGADAVLGLKLHGVAPATMAALRRRAPVALWYVDCFGPRVPPWLQQRVAHADLVATTARGLVPALAEHTTAPVRWLPEGAYLPALPEVRLTPGERRVYGGAVAFVGNVRHGRGGRHPRERLLRAVSREFPLTVWGVQGAGAVRGLRVLEWPVHGPDLVRVCRASAIVLGINQVNTVDGYFSSRTFLTLAAGGFHLTHYVPGLETMFENHRHLVWFHDDDECLELIRHYLPRGPQRARIARAGRAWTRQRYGMGRSVRRLLAELDALN
jgi:hypothetical protein